MSMNTCRDTGIIARSVTAVGAHINCNSTNGLFGRHRRVAWVVGSSRHWDVLDDDSLFPLDSRRRAHH